MAKSRSKVSHQPVKTSSRAAAKVRPSAKSTTAVVKVAAKPAKAAANPAAKIAAKKGQWVYAFGGGKAEGRAEMRNLLGGKGAGLAEMAHLGLPVPPGFTITTEVCSWFYANGKSYPSELRAQVAAGLAEIEKALDARFGDADNPLLVSVRSGARASMPGMMDT